MKTFHREEQVRLITVPGTPFVRLAQDANMERVVRDIGTIVCERYIAALPEVQALGPKDFVLDVGAFIGDTALIFADQGALVYAYEPQADAYCAALINCRANPFIRLFNVAVGNGEPVTSNEDPLAGNSGTRTVSFDHAGDPALRLSDQLLPRRVTFVKIDVEGFEPAVIRGGLELFKRDLPLLLVEIYPAMLARHGYTVDDVTGPLHALGYTTREAIGNSSEVRWDILCVPPPSPA